MHVYSMHIPYYRPKNDYNKDIVYGLLSTLRYTYTHIFQFSAYTDEIPLPREGYFIAYTLFHWLLQVVTDYSLELTRYIKEKVSIQTDLH